MRAYELRSPARAIGARTSASVEGTVDSFELLQTQRNAMQDHSRDKCISHDASICDHFDSSRVPVAIWAQAPIEKLSWKLVGGHP